MVRAVVAVALLVAAPTLTMAADCPRGCIGSTRFGETCYQISSVDSTFEGYQLVCASDSAGFNIPAASLYTKYADCSEDCEPWVAIEDEFTVWGPPLGQVVQLTARLDLHISGDCSLLGNGIVEAEIQHGLNLVGEDWEVCPLWQNGETLDTHISLPITAQAGTPFAMRVFLTARGGCSAIARIVGQYSFEGLSPSEAIDSCGGYSQGAVPTEPATWSRLKAQYR